MSAYELSGLLTKTLLYIRNLIEPSIEAIRTNGATMRRARKCRHCMVKQSRRERMPYRTTAAVRASQKGLPLEPIRPIYVEQQSRGEDDRYRSDGGTGTEDKQLAQRVSFTLCVEFSSRQGCVLVCCPPRENVLFVPNRNVLLTRSRWESGRTRSFDHDPAGKRPAGNTKEGSQKLIKQSQAAQGLGLTARQCAACCVG